MTTEPRAEFVSALPCGRSRPRRVAGVGGLPTVPPLGVKGAPQAPHPLRGRPSAALDPEPLAARQPAGGAGTGLPGQPATTNGNRHDPTTTTTARATETSTPHPPNRPDGDEHRVNDPRRDPTRPLHRRLPHRHLPDVGPRHHRPRPAPRPLSVQPPSLADRRRPQCHPDHAMTHPQHTPQQGLAEETARCVPTT